MDCSPVPDLSTESLRNVLESLLFDAPRPLGFRALDKSPLRIHTSSGPTQGSADPNLLDSGADLQQRGNEVNLASSLNQSPAVPNSETAISSGL